MGRRKEFRIDLVRAREFREVGHEDRRVDDMREGEALVLQDQPHILQHAACLIPDIPNDRSAGLGGVDRDLARTEEEIPDADAMGVGTERGSGRRGTDRELGHRRGLLLFLEPGHLDVFEDLFIGALGGVAEVLQFTDHFVKFRETEFEGILVGELVQEGPGNFLGVLPREFHRRPVLAEVRWNVKFPEGLGLDSQGCRIRGLNGRGVPAMVRAVPLPWTWVIPLLLLLVAASFFFAAAETALFALGPWRARRLAEQRPGAGPVVAELLAKPDDLLASLVLGNTVANFLLVALAILSLTGENWQRFLGAIALLGVLLFACEVTPKALAIRSPETWALRVSRPLRFFVRITHPLLAFAQGLVARVLNPVLRHTPAAPQGLSGEEYADLVDLAQQQGALNATEKEIIHRVLALNQRTAGDAMRPRARMTVLPDDLEVEALVRAARESRHHRIPLYDETPDNIVAVLNTRTLLLSPDAGLDEALEFPSFVPETMNLMTLFQALQRQQRGMAIVLDEFGGAAGLVTVEDILETVVGPIRGEGEAEGFVMERLAPGRWRVNGAMRLDDFAREFPALGDDDDVDTLGGLVVKLAAVVPAAGDVFTHRGVRFTVKVADERRVRELMVEAVGGGT